MIGKNIKNSELSNDHNDLKDSSFFLNRIGRNLANIGKNIAVLAIIAMTLIVAANTIFRALPGIRSFTFTEEYTGYLFIAVAFLGLAETFRSGNHVRVTILRNLMKPKLRRLLEAFMTLIAIAVITIIGWFGVKLFWEGITSGERAQTVVQTPLWIPQALVPVGSAIFLLVLICHLGIQLSRPHSWKDE